MVVRLPANRAELPEPASLRVTDLREQLAVLSGQFGEMQSVLRWVDKSGPLKEKLGEVQRDALVRRADFLSHRLVETANRLGLHRTDVAELEEPALAADIADLHRLLAGMKVRMDELLRLLEPLDGVEPSNDGELFEALPRNVAAGVKRGVIEVMMNCDSLERLITA